MSSVTDWSDEQPLNIWEAFDHRAGVQRDRFGAMNSQNTGRRSSPCGADLLELSIIRCQDLPGTARERRRSDGGQSRMFVAAGRIAIGQTGLVVFHEEVPRRDVVAALWGDR